MPWRRSILLSLLTVVYLLFIGIYLFPGWLPGPVGRLANTGTQSPSAIEIVEVTDADGNRLLVQMEPTETPTSDPNGTLIATPERSDGETGLFAPRSTPVPGPVEEINRLVVRTENNNAPLFTAVVRHGPGRWYRVATLLEPATDIDIILGAFESDEGLWYFVEAPDGQRGWIRSDLVQAE